MTRGAQFGEGTPAERRAPRERAFLQARLSFANGAMSFPCLVTQISATGARLAVEDAIALPDRFHVSIPRKDIDCQARLVWRKDGHAAVAFPKAGSDSDKTRAALIDRLAALEADNARLRDQVAELVAELKIARRN